MLKVEYRVVLGMASQSPLRSHGRSFTLVEMLAVMAIMCVLMVLLLPMLGSALGASRTTSCLNNLHGLGVAHASYQEDWHGFMLPSFGTQWWERKLTPYLGMTKETDFMPTLNPGNVFTCSEQPKGNGTYPSFARNNFIGTNGGGVNTQALRLNRFSTPSRKVFLADALGDTFSSGIQFSPREYNPSPSFLALRHLYLRANVLFLDGRSKGYGTPPLPLISNDADGGRWLYAATMPPEDL